MANALLDRVLPQELAERRQLIEIEGEIGDYERLPDIVEADLKSIPQEEWPPHWRSAPVAVRLQFDWIDDQRAIPRVSGRATAQMTAVCQRCLESFVMPLTAEIDLIFVHPKTGTNQATEFDTSETWETEDETLRLLDLIEESLVMAMPLALMHETSEQCGPLVMDTAEKETNHVRPFADLKSLMKKADR